MQRSFSVSLATYVLSECGLNEFKIMERIKSQSTAGLGKDEDDFRQFESKIDEVLDLLKGMNSCDRKYQSPVKHPANE